MIKLKLIRCLEVDGQIISANDPNYTFEVTINPENYSRTYGRRYSGTEEEGGKDKSAIGKSAAITKFSRPTPEKLSFSIVLDGTGVVPDAVGVKVADQVLQLRKTAYDFVGDEHEPAPVKIVWGAGLDEFYGRLTDLTVDYTLFKSDGTPLRAKIKLDFVQAMTEREESSLAKRKSPDMTHVIRVREGDTLPLLCQRVYKDDSKYLAVARLNDLDTFRDLKPNTLLRFPPMR